MHGCVCSCDCTASVYACLMARGCCMWYVCMYVCMYAWMCVFVRLYGFRVRLFYCTHLTHPAGLCVCMYVVLYVVVCSNVLYLGPSCSLITLAGSGMCVLIVYADRGRSVLCRFYVCGLRGVF